MIDFTIDEMEAEVTKVLSKQTEWYTKRKPRKRCSDCGAIGESVGHMDCQYPQNH